MPQTKLVKAADLARGAVTRVIDRELERIIQNIHDPNTSPTKTRKLTLTISFKPDKESNRESASYSISCVPTLAPAKEIEGKIFSGLEAGKPVLAEFVPDDNYEILED